MAVSSLKGVNVVTKKRADGSVYRAYYHRASGKRLRGEPNSAEFQEDFAAAEGLQAEAALAALDRDAWVIGAIEPGGGVRYAA